MRDTGLMCANMLRAFQVGKAFTSAGEPSSRIRSSRLACAQLSCPACHLTKASASAVMVEIFVEPAVRLAELGFSELDD
jgi:hypothetical protein